MTMAIAEILSIMPSGLPGMTLSLSEVGDHLAAHYNTEHAKKRESQHLLREALLTDGGCDHIEGVIDEVFADRETAGKYKPWVKYSRHNNAFKRIINDLSSVYTMPATRSISSGDETYQQLLKDMQFDVSMQQVNRQFNAHQILLAAPRVRDFDFMDAPDVVLDVVTPANFRVILHPNDNSLPIGWMTRTEFRSARQGEGRAAAWLLETSHESVMLDDRMSPISDTYKEHDLGMSRWVPLARLPNRAGFWPGEEGEDLVAAAVTIWLNSVFQNKETKSANKQPVLSGDTTAMSRQQAADSETAIELDEGTAISTVDMGVDTAIFHANADHALGSVGNNYGLSESLIKHEGVQSAEARELMRTPLKELRASQQPMFERFEHKLAIVKSKLLTAHRHPQAFDSAGWRINHNDAQAVLSEKESLERFETEKRLGLDDTIALMRRRDRDLKDDAEAWIKLQGHIEVETTRIAMMQDLQRMGTGPSTPITETVQGPGQPPTQHERSIVDDEATAAQAGRQE